MIGNPNDKTSFLQKLSLINTQAAYLCNALTNNSLPNIKLWKTQLSKIKQSSVF